MSIAREPKSIKNLRSGDLLIQCAKESHEKKSTTDEDILWSKMLRNTPFILEHIQGYYSLSSLEQSDKRWYQGSMLEQGVTDVRRITVRRDGVTKLTNTYVLTFNSPNLLTVVKIGFMQVNVDVYIPK